ncbi:MULTISPECIES: hypothetical protein [Mycobacterium]|uniref:Uncharacterized protein n=1 Tax=Mycobacterium paraffinicum TaxID=53378 RepID=A0A1Q4HP54_9MYCO|nr:MULTISPECIES: hypothetical protein [Mycobacterium]OJZ69468.1 hypothetical protein BRW65_22960 [Mycobacterium paraffinicum]
MSSAKSADGAAAAARPPGHRGWVVCDPAGYPYAWYGIDLAAEAAAAMALLEPDPVQRQQMTDAGWSVRVGSGVELALGAGLTKATA